MACTVNLTAPDYERHRPELTPLHRVVSTHLPAFLDRVDEAGGLPAFVRDELTAYLDCGLPEKGCALLECPSCGLVHAVAFS